MSNNKERRQVTCYRGSVETWVRFHDKPKNVEHIDWYTATASAVASIPKNKLNRMNMLVLYFYPLGTYAGNRKIKTFSVSKKKVFVRYELDSAALHAFSRYRSQPNCFLNYIYDSVYKTLESFYDMENLHGLCSWGCYTERQYLFMVAKSSEKIKPAATLLQREQGDVLEKLLSMDIDELLGNYDLERFLSKLKMSFLEFEKLYMEYNGLR